MTTHSLIDLIGTRFWLQHWALRQVYCYAQSFFLLLWWVSLFIVRQCVTRLNVVIAMLRRRYGPCGLKQSLRSNVIEWERGGGRRESEKGGGGRRESEKGGGGKRELERGRREERLRKGVGEKRELERGEKEWEREGKRELERGGGGKRELEGGRRDERVRKGRRREERL